MQILDSYRAANGNYILDSQAVSASGTTVTPSTGNTALAGLAATVLSGTVINCTIGQNNNAGLAATVLAATTINLSVGAMTATGLGATVTIGGAIVLTPNPARTVVSKSKWNGPMRVGEKETFTADFAGGQYPRIAPGATVIAGSEVWTCRAVKGVDSNPSAMVVGASTVSGAKVSNSIVALVPGVQYQLFITAQTSDGQTLSLPEPGDDLLYVF
jgi:hypothetical protein